MINRYLEAGSLIADRYEVVKLLGEGGMGVVLQVTDRELGEDVALKFLREEFVDSPEMLERFRSEVRLARRVTHRNVARTFDLSVFDGVRFLTMEHVRGAALSTLMARGHRLPLSEVLRVAAEIARGLVEAHAVGVVHRDLKPGNVLLADERVVITDFGIACLARDPSTGNEIAGTPPYMAPEQLQPSEIDGRADVYALGVIMFRALTGQSPFPGNRLAQAAAAMMEDAPDPRTWDSSIPRSVADTVRDAMAKDRGLRLDAQLLLQRIETLRGGRSYEGRARVPDPAIAIQEAPTVLDSADALIAREAQELYLRAKGLYLSMNDIVEARALLERANALCPDDAAIMSALGATLTRLCFLRDAYDRELNSKAEDFSLRALAADSRRGETFNTLGILRLQQGDVRAAARGFREALARAPEQWEAHAYLGGLLCETLRVKEGLEHIDRAIEGEPGNVRAYFERAR